MSHTALLKALRECFPSGANGPGVSLIARLNDAALNLSRDRRVHVFIPDCHIVPPEDLESWGSSVCTPANLKALSRLLAALARLGTNTEVVVWQLGDLFDFWRVGKERQGVEARRSALQKGCREAWDSFDKTRVQRIVGNHDDPLEDSPDSVDLESFIPPDPDQSADSDVLVLHGHQFDQIERLDSRLKEFFMRGATQKVDKISWDMMSAANPNWGRTADPRARRRRPNLTKSRRWEFLSFDLTAEEPVPLGGQPFNVMPAAPVWRLEGSGALLGGGGEWVDAKYQQLYVKARERADQETANGRDVSLIVIGHTHHARIILGDRLDGKPFAFMDCGAWVGTGFLSATMNAPIWNAQIGVKVGDDLRIYQLGYEIDS
jgi:UDP-2,3-diacylglucosamine pyrophosphatase LpxH